MSEITPPPPPPITPSLPTAAPPKVTITNPPDAMARQLSLGARLDAVITTAAPKGKILIDTAFGRLAIQTGFPLPKNGALQLQLQAKGGSLQFLITAIHGMPPKTALRALGLIPSPAGQSSGAPAPAVVTGNATVPNLSGPVTRLPAAVNLTVGAIIAATLFKPPTTTATPGAAGTAPGATAQPGQTPPGHATPGQGQPPTAPGQAASTPASPGAVQKGPPGPATPATAQTGAQPGAGPASSLIQPGALFSLRITAFQPATGTATGMAAGGGLPPAPAGGVAMTPGATLTGVVTGTASTGHPVVQTHAGPLIIATRTPVPTGSTVSFEVLSQSTAKASGHSPTHASALPPPNPWQGWPALDEAVKVLHNTNPAAAQQLVQSVLPQPNAALAGNILFYLVALSGGNLRGWFGDGPTRALEKAQPDLLGRLRDDFGQIDRIAREPGPGEWRTTMIPIHNGAEIDALRLSLRSAGEDADDADEQKDGQGTRFIIDLDLSRIGRFQLDGLVHQGDKRMDLIVRTEDKLERTIEEGIRNIFQEASEVTGIKGGIVFQAAPPNFIEVPETALTDETLGLIV